MPLRPSAIALAEQLERVLDALARRRPPRLASSSTDSGCDATTSSASSVRASSSSGLAGDQAERTFHERSPSSSGDGHSFLGARDPNRRERRGLLDRDLAGLAQLEQREERDRLLDPREPVDLLLEVEPAPPAEQRPEPLEELRRPAGSAAPCGRARPPAARVASARSAAASASGLLRRDPRLGPRRERRRAEPEEAVAAPARAARAASRPPP